jgi:hypothetical protein
MMTGSSVSLALSRLLDVLRLWGATVKDAESATTRARTLASELGGRPRRPRSVLLGATLLLLSTLPASAAVVQAGNLRITLLGQVQPYKLPREGTAPIAVFVSGHVAAVKGGVPEQLQRLAIKVNRRALLQSRGLPICKVPEVQPASTVRALRECGPAVIGSGQFWAHIVLPEQGAYPTHGRLLIFNGRNDGHPAVLAHIYTSHPFATSFVIQFTMRHLRAGTYGTELVASLPEALGEWGFVDRIKLTLKRKYTYHGLRLSYFNAGCPAPPSTDRAAYHLAFATFSFSGGLRIGADVTKACGVKQ